MGNFAPAVWSALAALAPQFHGSLSGGRSTAGFSRTPEKGSLFIINSMPSVAVVVSVRSSLCGNTEMVVFLVFWCSIHKNHRYYRCFSRNTGAVGSCSVVFQVMP